MKKTIVILNLLIFFAFNLFAQTEKIKGQKYILKGKLLQNVEIRLCGYFAFANVAEFEILNFSDSSYTRKKIPLIISCPEFKGKNFFEQGNIYDIIVADENQAEFGWSIIDDQNLRGKYNLQKDLYVVSINKE